MRPLLVTLIALSASLDVALTAAPASAQPHAWPMTSQNAQNTGATLSDGPSHLGVQQHFAVDPSAFLAQSSSVIDKEGNVYITGSTSPTSGKLYAITPTGAPLPGQWPITGPAASGYPWASPAIAADGTIYAAFGRFLYAYNKDGTSRWNTPVDSGFDIHRAPMIGPDGTVYITSLSSFIAVSPTGTVKWTNSLLGSVHSAAIATNGVLFISGGPQPCCGGLTALNPDGSVLWSSSFDGTAVAPVDLSDPVVAADGLVYVIKTPHSTTSLPTYLLALDPATGDIVHQRIVPRAGDIIFRSLSIAPNGDILLFTDSSVLLGFSHDLSVEWFTFSFSPYRFATQLAIDGSNRYYFSATDGTGHQNHLYILSSSGEVIDERDTDTTRLSPGAIASTQVLYLGDSEGQLVAIGPPYSPPAVSAIAPNGGEVLMPDTIYHITWTASAGTNAIVDFNVSVAVDGVTFAPIAECANLPPSARQCSWHVPSVATQVARVRVTAHDTLGQATSDESDTAFSIVLPLPVTPQLAAISPAIPVPDVLDQDVTVTGNGFVPGLTVTVDLPGGGSSSLSGAQILSMTPTSFVLRIRLADAGPYTLRVTSPGGATSNALTFVASSGARVPDATIQPPSGIQLASTFVVNGTGFSPGGEIRRFIRQPAWSGWAEIGRVAADATGRVFWGYQPDCGHSPGTTVVVLVDAVSASSTPVREFSVTANPTACAGLAISDLQPRQAVRGGPTTFTLTGTGFTPDLTAYLIDGGASWRIPAFEYVSGSSFRVTPDIGAGLIKPMQIRLVRSSGASASAEFTALAGGDVATFVADIAIQDNTVVSAGAGFAKTWRFRNSGSTTWSSAYQLVFVARDQMSGPSSTPIGGPSLVVQPEGTVDVTVQLQAPTAPGRYQGYWQLQAPSGQRFGPQVWALIQVSGAAEPTPPVSRDYTVVTHGRETDYPDWVLPTAVRIRTLLNQQCVGGCVVGRHQSYGFLWQDLSDNFGSNWAMAAGDLLFGELAERLRATRATTDIHLIGHSLGTVVIGQAAGRLAENGYRVAQMTLLDPVTGCCGYTNNEPTHAWEKVGRVDTYWGSGKVSLASYDEFDPRFTVVPFNTCGENTYHRHLFRPLSAIELDHSEVKDWYIDTVFQTTRDDWPITSNDGWYWSPFRTPELSFPDNSNLFHECSGKDRAQFNYKVVFNGDFSTTNLTGSPPGYRWEDAGNVLQYGFDNDSGYVQAAQSARGFGIIEYFVILEGRGSGETRLRHAPLFIPEDARSLSFDIGFSDQSGAEAVQASFGGQPIPNCSFSSSGRQASEPFGVTHSVACDVSVLRGRRGTLDFSYRGARGSRLAIDNVVIGTDASPLVSASGLVQHIDGYLSPPGSFGRKGPTADAEPRVETGSQSLVRVVRVDIRSSQFEVWDVAADVPWVSMSPTTLGGEGGLLTLSIDLSALGPGSHQGYVNVKPHGWVGSGAPGVTIPVLITLDPGETLTIAASGGPNESQYVFTAGALVGAPNAVAGTNISLVRVARPEQGLPPGFIVGSGDPVYRISTTAPLGDHSFLALSFDSASAGSGLRPAILWWDGTAFRDVTTGVDLERQLVFSAAAVGDFLLAVDTRPAPQTLAEGSTGTFFDEFVAVANPSTETVTFVATYLQPAGVPVQESRSLLPLSHQTIDIRQDVVGLTGADVSVQIATDNRASLAVQRAMEWPQGVGYASHTSTAVSIPSVTWLFAEGATLAPFDLFLLLANATDHEADVLVRFLKDDGTVHSRRYLILPHSRYTIWVDEIPELADAALSIVVESQNGVAVFAERAMYWGNQSVHWRGGHASAGAAQVSSRWYFAEGATGSYFDLFLLLANPHDRPVEATAKYLRSDGVVVSDTYLLPPTSRTTVFIDLIEGLQDAALSTVVETPDGDGIVAERAMYWGGPAPWVEGHSSLGAPQLGPAWSVAGGMVGTRNAATYVLVGNPSTNTASLRVTVLREEGRPLIVKTFDVPPTTRFNLEFKTDGSEQFPEIVDERFGVLVESLADIPLIVEQATYSDALGVLWEAGGNTMAQQVR